MKLFGRELVEPSQLEKLEEQARDLRTIKRELEDVGYHILNAGSGTLDVKPEQREKVYRRLLRYYLEDPIVGASIDMLPTYVFGRGLPKPDSSNPEVQKALDMFWEDEDNKLVLTTLEAQYAKLIELQLQANIYFVIFENEETGIKVGTIPHEEIVDIIVHPENKNKHLWYKREYLEQKYDFEQGQYVQDVSGRKKIVWYQHWENTPPEGYHPINRDGEKVAKGKVYHVRLGGIDGMKFGVPHMQRILDWAKAHNEWMRARVAVAKAAAAFAWERKLKTGSDPNKVMSIARSWASGARQPAATASNVGEWGAQEAAFGPRYASLLTTNEGVDYTFRGGNPTGAGDAASDQKMFRSMISAGVRMPQHFLGDEGSANLATATAMNEPVIRMMEFMQEFMEGMFRRLIDRHLKVLKLDIIDKNENKVVYEGQQVDQADAPEQMPVAEAFVEDDGEGGNEPGDLGILDAENEKKRPRGVTGFVIDPLEAPDAASNKAIYKLAFPPILNRDVGSMLSLVIDAVTGLDPAGDNVDLTRWAFTEILKIFGEVEPERIVDKIFPSHNLADQFSTEANREGGAAPGSGGPPLSPGPADPSLAPVGDMGVTPAPGRPPTGATPRPGMGNSMDGAQNGARMGASLQEAARMDEEFDRIWGQVEREIYRRAEREGRSLRADLRKVLSNGDGH